MTNVFVESLLRTPNRAFLPSPCLLRSDAAKLERVFNRDNPDAEDVLRAVFAAHDKSSADWVDVETWVEWCMDSALPKHSETSVKKSKGARFHNWLGVG